MSNSILKLALAGVLFAGAVVPTTASAETYRSYHRRAHRKTVKRVAGGAVAGAAAGALIGRGKGAAIGAAVGGGAGLAYDRHEKHEGKQ